MGSGCFEGDCDQWGWPKAFDGDAVSPSVASTAFDCNPWMQLDLGAVRQDIYGVRITARAEWTHYQLDNLSVYVGAAADGFAVGAACVRDISFGWGEEKAIACPAGVGVRYVTLQRGSRSYITCSWLSLAEMAILAIGGGAPQEAPTQEPVLAPAPPIAGKAGRRACDVNALTPQRMEGRAHAEGREHSKHIRQHLALGARPKQSLLHTHWP